MKNFTFVNTDGSTHTIQEVDSSSEARFFLKKEFGNIENWKLC